MVLKQISVTVPDVILKASNSYCKQYGYRNIQEFIVDLLRKKVLFENVQRYKEIEQRMSEGVGVKKFNQNYAIKYLRGL
ncbi:hypothetical protein J4232_03830 [Candidatus Woesearchaeota archaeon]|nr:hypothetical protein [Candidatus Woesearchaeota archaeon]